MRKDLEWWEKYLAVFNGIEILWLQELQTPQGEFATDACLTGMGATLLNECFSVHVPQNYKDWSITQLEMLAVLVACRRWATRLSGLYIFVHCDNQAVIHCINKGKAHEAKLQQMLRCITWVAAKWHFALRAKYITSEDNVVPDRLSRSLQDRAASEFIDSHCTTNKITKVMVPGEMFNICCEW